MADVPVVEANVVRWRGGAFYMFSARERSGGQCGGDLAKRFRVLRGGGGGVPTDIRHGRVCHSMLVRQGPAEGKFADGGKIRHTDRSCAIASG